MASINIRDEKDDPIDEIVFAENQFLRELASYDCLKLCDDEHGEEIDLSWGDIPYLIKALELALELAEKAKTKRINTSIR